MHAFQITLIAFPRAAQVTALTTSLSVNVWTTSGDGRLLDAIVDYQLPMNAAWRGSKRERALTTVMHLLVAGGVGNGPEWQGGTAGDDSLTGDAALHAEVAGRYVVLFGDDGLRSLSGGSGSGSRRRSRCRARNKSEENAFRGETRPRACVRVIAGVRYQTLVALPGGCQPADLPRSLTHLSSVRGDG